MSYEIEKVGKGKMNDRGDEMRINRRAAMVILLTVIVVGFMLYHRPGFLTATGLEQPKTSWAVYFSPRGGATQTVVKAINEAQSSVLVQAYSFTSEPIAKALLVAHRRGIKIEVILDRSQQTEQYSEADFVANEGIPTMIDDKHAIACNKIIIVDGETVLTGSFNFTRQAEEQNAENLLVIRDKALAALYTQNWKDHAQHSETYTGRMQQNN